MTDKKLIEAFSRKSKLWDELIKENKRLEEAISTLIYGKCLCCANREGCQLPSNYLRSECYKEDTQVLQEIKSGKGLRRI